MYSIFFLLLLILALVSIETRVIKASYDIYVKIFLQLLVIVFILLVGLRKVGVAVDDFNYSYMFTGAIQGHLHKDIAFNLIANYLGQLNLVFFVFALTSISLKSFFIFKTTKYFGLVFLLYFSSYFFLHDFVQIRAAVSSALLLWIIYFLGNKNFFIIAILTALAIAFHLSAIIFIPLFFLRKKNTKKLYLVLGVVSLLLAFVYSININSFESFIPELFFKRLKFFLEKDGASANLLNPIVLMQYVFAILIFLNWDKLVNDSKYSVYVVKIFLIGLYVFLILNKFPKIGFRVYELLMIVQLPLADILIRNAKPKSVVVSFVILLSMLYYYYYVIKYPVINPYLFFFQ